MEEGRFMDLKQLQYFVACAQTGSFSDAAKILYSTQPSVSKVIKSLEDTLGMQLFERLPRGIRLTVQGQKVYHYACRITNEIDVLENMASRGMTKWIRISMNPSSWFANQFVDFYNETFEKNYHFQLTTAGVRSVMERVRDYMDDIGFVYILSQQQENFLYELAKNKMEFIPMYETDVIFYPGRKTEFYDSGKEKVLLEELEGSRFIQNYQDEFFDIGSVQENAFQWKDLDISVLTNSDYIMEKMLKNSKVSNVSGSYLSENKTGTTPGIPLELGDNKVIFGYILHKGEKTDDSVEEFLTFLKGRLPKS
jgi:DNA-binding transcriptional LysR family regulator